MLKVENKPLTLNTGPTTIQVLNEYNKSGFSTYLTANSLLFLFCFGYTQQSSNYWVYNLQRQFIPASVLSNDSWQTWRNDIEGQE